MSVLSLACFLAAFHVASSLGAAPPSLLGEHPEEFLLHEVLELRPVPKHHFESQAPQSCGGAPPLELSPRRFRCQLSEPGRVQVVASVCDDAKTFCRPERFFARVFSSKDVVSEKIAPPQGAGQSPRLHLRPLPPGFFRGGPQEAQREAEEKGELIFIHFGAVWCPPCNLLEELIYPRREFQEATSGMIRLSLDADSGLSWNWKARFKVRGYPTLIVADAQLREIGRLVSYRPLGPLLAWLEEIREMKRLPMEEALRLAKGEGPAAQEARLRAGLWRYERGEWEESASLLQGLPYPRARRHELLAHMELAEQAEDPAALEDALKSLVREFPEDVEYVYWISGLISLNRAYALRHLRGAEKNVRAWKASSELEKTPYNPGWLEYALGDLLELAREMQRSRAAFVRSSEYWKDLSAQSDPATARGANLERADALYRAGRLKEAKVLYESLARIYSKEFTFHYYYASMLAKLKEYPVAYERAQHAVEHAYGDNYLRAVRLKAEIELKLGQPQKASRTVEEALKETLLPRSTSVRTHRYLAGLRELEAELHKASGPAENGR